jgi:hypothetical protein
MTRFLLYEEIVESNDQKQNKLLAEIYKFRNGKIACSFNLPVPSVFIYDNLDQFVSVYCNDKIKLHQIPEQNE